MSICTSSQAINNNPKVTAETRARVLDAAHTLGYEIKTQRIESSPRDSRLSVIGIPSKHDIGSSPF